jgi:hypothetical protein
MEIGRTAGSELFRGAVSRLFKPLNVNVRKYKTAGQLGLFFQAALEKNFVRGQSVFQGQVQKKASVLIKKQNSEWLIINDSRKENL